MKKTALFLIAMLLIGLNVAGAQETYRFAQRDTCDLYLDVFRPAEGSQTQLDGIPKPTILFVFGGGFIQGERSGKWERMWYRRLNDNGYAVVSVDYRLGMKGYKVKKGLAGALKAVDRFLLSQQVGVEDVYDAVAFLAANRESIGIDTDNIVLAGSSAGAIISLAAEYGIVNGKAQGLPEGFNFKGVMSFAGAVISTTGAPHFEKAPCPVLLLHGTADQAVQYNRLNMGGKGLWGSSWLVKDWQKKGYGNYCIYRFKDSSHDVAAYMNYLWDIEKAFLEQNVILGHARCIDAVVDDASLPRWGQLSMDDIYAKEK